MEIWFIITVTLCISFLLKSILSFLFSTPSSTDFHGKKKKPLPPGPLAVPVIGNLLWLRRSMWEIEPILRDLRKRYGPLVTLRIGPRPAIFVTSHDLAHRALVQNGAVFSDRPSSLPASRILNSNQHNVSSAAYGPTWRLLRRNLTSEILHPSRVKSYTAARTWVLGILLRRLAGESESQSAIKVVDHFQYTMFCLLVLMCFGDRLDENQIKQIEAVQRRLLLSFSRFNVLNLWPRLGKYLFRNRWNELIEIRRSQDAVLIPLIKERIKTKQERENKHRRRGEEEEEEAVVAYVDTLVDLELPEEKRKLNDDEMVSLCSEFLNAGTDTTSTALQWIMANLVKFPHIQAKLYEEITGIVGPPPPPPQSASGGDETKAAMAEVKEEDLHKMPYLKAVVLEGLRRHPPGHFVLPHTVTEDVELDGYTVPKTATVNFMVAEMGLDPNVWEEPLVFKPERFLNSGGEATEFDVTGSREIKMMPFGAGRRICPGFGLALLHLEYFVANLVWYFEWSAVDGDDVDMSEKPEFTIVMKNPLRAHLSPRIKS